MWKGLKKFEKEFNNGKLDKNSINTTEYNKYFKLKLDIKVSINYSKYEMDAKWDGLMGIWQKTCFK